MRRAYSFSRDSPPTSLALRFVEVRLFGGAPWPRGWRPSSRRAAAGLVSTIAPVRAVAIICPDAAEPSARRQQSTWMRRLCSIGALSQCRHALCSLADSDRGRWMGVWRALLAGSITLFAGALLHLKSGGAAVRSADGGAARLSGDGRPACGWPIRLSSDLRSKPLKSCG